MSKEKKIIEMENKKEQFVALSKEVYPLIEQIREALAKAHSGNLPVSASALTVTWNSARMIAAGG